MSGLDERLSRWTIREFIETLARRAERFADQAGVGGMETAGMIISYLATHPMDIEPFMVGGVFELPENWHSFGCLTWQAANGKIVHPEYARRARIVNRLKRTTPNPGAPHE